MREHADERASPLSGGRAKGRGGLLGTALAACAALAAASCVPVVGRGAGRGPVYLAARPVAALAGAVGDGDDAPPLDAVITPLLPAGAGVRVGLTTYPVTSDWDVDSRMTFGGYFHFAERETSRFEGGISLLRDNTDSSENHAYVAGVNYVGYLGAQGFLYWSLGGGAISETLYADNYFFGYLEAAAGYWIGSGQRGIDLRAGIQTPFGSDVNVNLVVFFVIGYDI